MHIRNINEINNLIGRGQRVLGLDLGTKTIGLALSDVERIVEPVDSQDELRQALKGSRFFLDAVAS